MKQNIFFKNLIRFVMAGWTMIVWLIITGGLFVVLPPWAEKYMIIGNYGLLFYRTFLVIDTITYMFFGLFVSLIVYRFFVFRDQTQQTGRKSWLGGLGGMFGAIVGGCSACTLGWLGYAGLATFMMTLPFAGGEIKILSLMLLSRVTYSLLTKLYQCDKPSKA